MSEDIVPDEKHFPAALRQAIGFTRVVALDGGSASATVLFEGRPEFTHSGGTTVQGGIITAWIDHTMAWAVAARDPRAGVASLEIKVSFLSRVPPGPNLVTARAIKWGRNVVFLEGAIVTAEGKTLVTASSSGMLSISN